jgi:hypothetical protein
VVSRGDIARLDKATMVGVGAVTAMGVGVAVWVDWGGSNSGSSVMTAVLAMRHGGNVVISIRVRGGVSSIIRVVTIVVGGQLRYSCNRCNRCLTS